MSVEKYFGVFGRIFWFMEQLTIRTCYPVKLFLDLAKPKHKTIHLRANNVSLNGDAHGQNCYLLLIKLKKINILKW